MWLTIVNHFEVLGLCGARVCVAPEQVHSLTLMEIAQLLRVNLHQLRVVQLQ